MNETQIKLAIDNIKLMHFLLNRYKNQFDDHDIFIEFKEQFIIRYVQSCMTYNDKIGTFSAYLSKTVYLYFINFMGRKIKNINRDKNVLSFQQHIFDEGDVLLEEIVENKKDKNNMLHFKINEILKYIKEKYTYKEYFIFVGMLMGYTQIELSKTFSLSQTQISRILKKIQKDIKCNFQK